MLEKPRDRGGPGRLLKLKLAALAAGATLGGVALAASITTFNLFELDRNATDEAGGGDDAAQIYCDEVDATRTGECGPSAKNVAPSIAAKQVGVFVQDKYNDKLDDGFGLGSKDSLDTTGWTRTISPVGDKVDISNAFAAVYSRPTGTGTSESILYVGLDKVADNGDAAIGFWILQNPVSFSSTGVFQPPHSDGDVLIQADLVSGGRVGRYDVYTWGPNGGLNEPVADSQGKLFRAIKSTNCGDASADDDACGVVNAGNDPSPWHYEPKSGDENVFPQNSYFEGGLNLTALFPEGVPCAATFLAETRQSQSETASLADFAMGDFKLCSFQIEKDGPATSKPGDRVTYTVTVTNDGAVEITKDSIVDSLAGDLTLDDGCPAKLAPGAQCKITYSLTIPVNASTTSDYENSVTAVYTVGTHEIVDSSTHAIDLFKPGITIDKKANGSNGPLTINQGQNLTYTLLVTNTGTSDTPTLNCTVKDPSLSYEQNLQLGAGQSQTLTLDRGAQLVANEAGFVNTATVKCSPVGFPNVVEDDDSVTVKIKPVNPTLAVSKTADPYTKNGDSVTYVITITNTTTDQALSLTAINDALLGGSLIDHPGSTCPKAANGATLAAGASCTITASRTTVAGDSSPLTNTVSVTAVNVFNNSITKTDTAQSVKVAPSVDVTKDCLSGEIAPGETANFRIRVQNTGDVPLVVNVSDPDLNVSLQNVALGTGTCVFDSNAADGCLEISASKTAGSSDVSGTVSVSGGLPQSYGLNNVISDSAPGTCPVRQGGGATRTLGFWKAHGSDDAPMHGYTCHVATYHVGFPILISETAAGVDRKTLENCADLFGLYWSSPAKLPDGSKRPALCQTKQQASWQLMAAILNSGLSNGATVPTDPVSGGSAIDALRIALSGSDRTNIIRLAGILGAYNESGDAVAILDGHGAIPPADPTGARLYSEFNGGTDEGVCDY